MVFSTAFLSSQKATYDVTTSVYSSMSVQESSNVLQRVQSNSARSVSRAEGGNLLTFFICGFDCFSRCLYFGTKIKVA